MSFLKKIFGGKKPPETTKPDPSPWIEAIDNVWKTRILDIRPTTQNMTSTSSDPQMAINAVSYGREDGTSFWGQPPVQDKEIRTNISFMTDGMLAPGELFKPVVMEHKWAIYFDGEHLIFVRSWLRKVFVVAKTKQINNELFIQQIKGEFTLNESEDSTIAAIRYLLISHTLGEIVPAPLPPEFSNDPQKAGLWAFSVYGKMAHYGTFDKNFVPAAQKPLRSNSLLHIAVARNQMEEIEKQVRNGIRLDYLAVDGLAPLHWSIVINRMASLEKLLALGTDPNVVDHSGFTALHMAADKGLEAAVEILLKNGADKTIVAQGHTALSFAQRRGNQKIVDLLS